MKQIPKLQWGGGNPWLPTRQQQAAEDFTRQVLSNVRNDMEQAGQRAAQFKKADNRANRKTLAPFKRNATATLQDALYHIGAFGNVSYDKAVGGISGNMTRNAIAKARQVGYDVDESTGSVTKKKITVSGGDPNKTTSKLSILITPIAPGAPATFSVTLNDAKSWTDPITGIGRLLQDSKPDLAATIHAAVPYLRLFTTYNTGGGTWRENMLPQDGEVLLKEIYQSRSGYTGENNFSIRPGTPVYDKYTKRNDDGSYTYPRQAAAMLSLQKQFGDVGMRLTNDGGIQVYDPYVWEPADSKEREQHRIDVGGIDPLTARMEQIARTAAEWGFAPRSLAGVDDRTSVSKHNTTTNRHRDTKDIGTDTKGEYFKRGNQRPWHGVPMWGFVIR